ncbi:MAG: class I SAM-dependent methyltransferase [Bacteroidota bacterium]|nr:class I SAM-dependent methyltransferase [Bacteroidota bacterium]
MDSDQIKYFYDEFAGDYDLMTQFESRFKKESSAFQKIVDQFYIKKVLDAGCGTGFHSILLSKLGCEVTAADISQNMIDLLNSKKASYGVEIKTVLASFQELAAKVDSGFDGVFCMGNSLPHLLTTEEIKTALDNFYRLLMKGGKLILQILNYNKILSEKKKIQSVREIQGKTFIRYYTYTESLLEFNIMTIDKAGNNIGADIRSILLFPIQKELLERLLTDSKYININIYGTISMGQYNPRESNDIFIIAEK